MSNLTDAQFEDIGNVLMLLTGVEDEEVFNLYAHSLVALETHPKNKQKGKYRKLIYDLENSHLESVQTIYSHYIAQAISSVSFMKQMRKDDDWYKGDPEEEELISRVLKLRNRVSPHIMSNYTKGLMHVILCRVSEPFGEHPDVKLLEELGTKVDQAFQNGEMALKEDYIKSLIKLAFFLRIEEKDHHLIKMINKESEIGMIFNLAAFMLKTELVSDMYRRNPMEFDDFAKKIELFQDISG